MLHSFFCFIIWILQIFEQYCRWQYKVKRSLLSLVTSKEKTCMSSPRVKCQCTIWYLSNVSDFADVPLNLEQSHHLQKYAGRLFILISSSIETAFDQTATDLWFAVTCIAFCKSWKSLKRGLCELENLSRKCIHSSNQSDHECEEINFIFILKIITPSPDIESVFYDKWNRNHKHLS